MAALLFHLISSTALSSLGLYHLICATKNHHHHVLNSSSRPQSYDYSAKPYYPIPSLNHFLKHLPLYLLILFLLSAFSYHAHLSSQPNPLLKGATPVHRFTSLQSASVLLLFLLLSLSLLLSHTTSLLPLPSSLFFFLFSLSFSLHSSSSSSSAAALSSGIQAKCLSLSSLISLFSSLLSFLLACNHRLFFAEAAMAASVFLQGTWVMQTGLFLYSEMFIPEGCHRLLDVVDGVEGSTVCDLEESVLRAVSIIDLAFVIHVIFAVMIVLIVYAVVARIVVGVGRYGAYESLDSGFASSNDPPHVQMKTLSGTQA